MASPDKRRDQGPPPGSQPELPTAGDSEPPFVEAPSLLDVLERLMDHGVVVEPSARAALPELGIAAGEASVAVAAVETVASAPDGDVWRELVATAEAADTAREPGAAVSVSDERRSAGGEIAALKRQLERLDA